MHMLCYALLKCSPLSQTTNVVQSQTPQASADVVLVEITDLSSQAVKISKCSSLQQVKSGGNPVSKHGMQTACVFKH